MHAINDTSVEQELMLIEREPWKFWAPLVKDRVAQFVEQERARWQGHFETLPSGFPTAEQHIRDMERAFADLLRMMGYARPMLHPSTVPVNMGEESAP